MNPIRHYFVRRALIQASEAHTAGYQWALSQLRQGVAPMLIAISSDVDPFDRGVYDAIQDFLDAHHELNSTTA